jgi:hypothetical protein
MTITILSEEVILFVMSASAVLGGIMPGFFCAYSTNVVLALDRFPSSTYRVVMQDINETVLNAVSGLVFFGNCRNPRYRRCWSVLHRRLDRAIWPGVPRWICNIHNRDILYDNTCQYPYKRADSDVVGVLTSGQLGGGRTRWARWNHIRTVSAAVSFVLYLGVIVSFGVDRFD